MADFANNIADGVRKAFLAGVGAVAIGAEATSKLVDDLVKKGELTVDQGKDLNRELTQKAKGAVDGAQETVLRAHLAGMTPEQRAAFVDRARSLTSDLDAKEQEAAKAEEPEDEGTTVTVEADDESEKDAEE
ncbi:hypothetical protein [uncultured Parolsenella sp.]|uniref:hypothetical protein n=1 Tax=uncultured Parolsenella sp. TaxID=2083008 RepID=UPI0025D1681B|nr:hypothetical protein [uncultured Parolsenella sp.]